MQEQIFMDDDEILVENYSTAPQDVYFEQVVAALQDIIMEPQFEFMQNSFMKKYHLHFQEVEENQIQHMNIFQQYQNTIEKYIENALLQKIPNFQMPLFLEMLESRTCLIDEQILDMLQSFSDFETFKRLILDYRAYYEEQEQLQLLTIKSNKIPEHKKVKSNTDNIFGIKNNTLDFNTKPLMMKTKQKPIKRQKTQDELLIPQLVLTVRPLKKMRAQQ